MLFDDIQALLEVILNFFKNCFIFLGSFNIVSGGITVLGCIIAFYVIYVLIDWFVPKG